MAKEVMSVLLFVIIVLAIMFWLELHDVDI